MYGGRSALIKALIDAYSLFANRMWSVMSPRSGPQATRVDHADRAV